MTAKLQQPGSRKRRYNQDKLEDLRSSSSPNLVQLALQQSQQMTNNVANYGQHNNNGGAMYGYNGNLPPNTPASPSNHALTKRQPDNQMTTAAYNDNSDMDYHPIPMDYDALSKPISDRWQTPSDDLEQRALVAKRDTLSKRKQIPPFVQKLSRNDLIRWSDDGDSFIVVDEDEFAKTLIPELFKHNNYASFVRQLNMYGFHKKVGLSDNSMRASERKNKNPSEYSNPYFKRNRPQLLWLIHKPKNAPGKGGVKARQEDAEDDADQIYNRDSPGPSTYGGVESSMSTQNRRQPLMLANGESTLPAEQFALVQRELAEIRRNQNEITKMLNLTRQEQYKQARQHHEQHTKNDSAINAILTFLATVYKKNLGLDGNNMFGTNTLPPRDQGHRNIVDIGDDKDGNSPASTQLQPYRRPPLLLKDGSAQSPVKSVDNPQSFNQGFPNGSDFYNYPTKPQYLHSPNIQELPDRTPSNRSSESPQIKPNNTSDEPLPAADVLSMINSVNSHNKDNFQGAQMQFPEAFSHLQNANGQVSPNQRQNLLQLMGDASPNSGNALAAFNSPDPATMAGLNSNQEQIDHLSELLKEQDKRMQNLSATIAPLSPSGSIPGVTDHSYNPQQGPDLDLDSFFNSNDYYNDSSNLANFDYANQNGDLPDFDFNTAPVEEQDTADTTNEDGRVVETVDSSEATSPANTVEDWGEKDSGNFSPRKLRRRN
ncbi:hypothetical protein P7C71_g2196, partial [Lecanoromycetidae sp. Uapishka_2]